MKRRSVSPKPLRLLDSVNITYSSSHWATFGKLRNQAAEILEGLGQWSFSSIVHGSLARGDVDEKSDIDVLIPAQTSTQLIESGLESAGLQIRDRQIVQATPVHSPKAHIFLDVEEKKAVTVPLSPLRKLELEFYRFGGTVSLVDINGGVRRPGCTKKLTLVEPTPEGHVESGVTGRELEVARLLGVSVDIVRERVRVLTRRDTVGRTGIFLKATVPEGMSFEEALQQLAKEKPALRRTLRQRESYC